MGALHHALRRFSTRPTFTLVAVATLALAIGANAAIFSLVQAVLLRPLAFADPGALVQVRGFDSDDQQEGNLSPADFLDFARESRVFASMGAHGFVNSFTITGTTGDAERVGGVNVTDGFFPTLGVQAALGRLFTLSADQPDAATTVVLADGFWRRRFAADPSAIGRTLLVNARP